MLFPESPKHSVESEIYRMHELAHNFGFILGLLGLRGAHVGVVYKAHVGFRVLGKGSFRRLQRLRWFRASCRFRV